MEGELIIMSLISTLGGLFGLYLINQNWFKRKEMEFKYSMARFKLGKKYKLKEAELPDKSKAGLGDLIKGIDRNKIEDILDMIQGGDEYESEDRGDLMQLYEDNKDLVNGFIDGIKKKSTGSEPEKPKTY